MFEGIAEAPVPSIMRGFSAPVKLAVEQSEEDLFYTWFTPILHLTVVQVKLVVEQSDEDLAFLMGHDTDSFNRWEAGQKLFTRSLLANAAAAAAGRPMAVGAGLVEAVRRTLADGAAERSLKAYALTLPALATVAEEMAVIDPEALASAARFTKRGLALALRAELEAAHAANSLPAGAPFRADREAIGMRRLKNVCLDYLAAIEDAAAAGLVLRQVQESAGCMTDVVAATAALAGCGGEVAASAREEALALFYERHARGNDLLLCKWLTLQAVADTPDCLARANRLLAHPDFALKNPNKSRALIGGFAANLRRFHAADGSGYAWLADRILEASLQPAPLGLCAGHGAAVSPCQCGFPAAGADSFPPIAASFPAAAADIQTP